jgi:NTP pyrophosphatase (non-canonical NTP hydrolase)
VANYRMNVLANFSCHKIAGVLDITSRRLERNELPPYPRFVDNLMSPKPTEADELLHACVGLSGEAGEVLDIAKKVWAYNKPLDIAKIMEELGDVRFYYQATLNFLGVSDEDVKLYNMDKLSKRFPGGTFNAQQAIAQADKSGSNGSFAPSGKPVEPVRKFIGQPAPVDKPVDRCGHGQPRETCTHRIHMDACQEPERGQEC